MKYRNGLPQLNGKQFLTDGGLETTLVFLEGIDLPAFAAIDMMASEAGRQRMVEYFEEHIEIAKQHGVGFLFESVTWRSSEGWLSELGYTEEQLAQYNRDAIAMLLALRKQHETQATPMVVSGCIGPRGDGYVAGEKMTIDEAREYHSRQIALFADAGVDCVTAITMNYVEEAAGIALAARDHNVPAVISFTVETDACLITGETIEKAIKAVDDATDSAPAYYMINCAHPTHFAHCLQSGEDWVKRIVGIRANASKCSHEELDNSEELDIGNPEELAGEYRALTDRLPHITVVGGCCGTDVRHIRAIAQHQYGDLRQAS